MTIFSYSGYSVVGGAFGVTDYWNGIYSGPPCSVVPPKLPANCNSEEQTELTIQIDPRNPKILGNETSVYPTSCLKIGFTEVSRLGALVVRIDENF